MRKREVEARIGRRGGRGNCGLDAIYERRINKKEKEKLSKCKVAELLVKP